MSEHTKEDLQKKIREIVEETPTVQQPAPPEPEPRVSDKEWYLRSLYHKLAQKWSK